MNLQKTADAIEYEFACCEKRIFDYEGEDDEQALRKLARKTEELQNEQRKLQQQLEQASGIDFR